MSLFIISVGLLKEFLRIQALRFMKVEQNLCSANVHQMGRTRMAKIQVPACNKYYPGEIAPAKLMTSRENLYLPTVH